ncbi:FG-GAP repeat domain-containing protein [Gemmatimonadota bacterium]
MNYFSRIYLLTGLLILTGIVPASTHAALQSGEESNPPIIAVGIGTQVLLYQYQPVSDSYELIWETVPSGRALSYQNSDVHWQPVFGDVDDDKDIELVSVDQSRLLVWGDRNTVPVSIQLEGDACPTGLAKVEDADGDGLNEILVGYHDKISIWRYGEETLQQLAVLDLPVNDDGEMIWHINVSDLNSDGVQDILVGGALHYRGQGALYLLRYQNGTLEIQGVIQVLMDADVAKIHDWDGDGRCEIFVGGNGECVQAIRWNPETKTFDHFWRSENLDGFIQGVALGDLDGDGQPELAAGSYSYEMYHQKPPTLYVFDRAEDGMPVLKGETTTMQVGYPGLLIDDFDGNGKSEILLNGMKFYQITPVGDGGFDLRLSHEIEGLGERPGEIQPNASVTEYFNVHGRRRLEPDITIQQAFVALGGQDLVISGSAAQVHILFSAQNVGAEASKIRFRLVCNDPRIELIQDEIFLDFLNSGSGTNNSNSPFVLRVRPGSESGPLNLRIEVETHGGFRFARSFSKFSVR